jgi:hypothetical protein
MLVVATIPLMVLALLLATPLQTRAFSAATAPERMVEPAALASTAVVTFWTEAPLSLAQPITSNSDVTILSDDAFMATWNGIGTWWVGGGVIATAREAPVGIIYRVDDTSWVKKMCDDYEGGFWRIDVSPCAWINDTSNAMYPGLHCNAVNNDNQICQAVAGIDSELVN